MANQRIDQYMRFFQEKNMAMKELHQEAEKIMEILSTAKLKVDTGEISVHEYSEQLRVVTVTLTAIVTSCQFHIEQIEKSEQGNPFFRL